MICFWCLNGIWGAFMLGPLHQNEQFFEGPTIPLSKLKFKPYLQNSRPSTQWTFFLIARGISIMFGPLESMFSATDYVQHIFQPLCMPPKCCFYLRTGHIAHSLYFSTKAIFFLMVRKGWMHFGPLCMQLRAPISFSLLYRTNSNPEKVQHFLVPPNSIKRAPNGLFFGAPTGCEVVLCWGRCTKMTTLLRDPMLPLSKLKFPCYQKIKIADFLKNKRYIC